MTDHFSVDSRQEIVMALKGYLADNAVVYFKTHSFHWNVEGPTFYSLHLMFEQFYKKLWNSMDDVAERIRAFAEKAPSSYMEMLKDATIREGETAPLGRIMAHTLRDDYLALSQRAQKVATIAEKHGDLVTMDMMIKKSTFLEKASWMLLSTITS